MLQWKKILFLETLKEMSCYNVESLENDILNPNAIYEFS